MICACGIGNIPDTVEAAQAHALLCTSKHLTRIAELEAEVESARATAESLIAAAGAETLRLSLALAAAREEAKGLTERVAVLEEIHREARWFSENVYPPDVWLPEDRPVEWDGDVGEEGLDEGGHHSKRMNWWLAVAAAALKGKP